MIAKVIKILGLDDDFHEISYYCEDGAFFKGSMELIKFLSCERPAEEVYEVKMVKPFYDDNFTEKDMETFEQFYWRGWKDYPVSESFKEDFEILWKYSEELN